MTSTRQSSASELAPEFVVDSKGQKTKVILDINVFEQNIILRYH